MVIFFGWDSPYDVLYQAEFSGHSSYIVLVSYIIGITEIKTSYIRLLVVDILCKFFDPSWRFQTGVW